MDTPAPCPSLPLDVPGVLSRAPPGTAVADIPTPLLLLGDDFTAVPHAPAFREALANPSVKPFSSLALQAAASPPAFRPLPVLPGAALAAAPRGSLGRWGHFVGTGVHMAPGSGGWARCIPARGASVHHKDAVPGQPVRRGLTNPRTGPRAPPPHRGFGGTSWQMLSCFSPPKLKRGSRSRRAGSARGVGAAQPSRTSGDEHAGAGSPAWLVALPGW